MVAGTVNGYFTTYGTYICNLRTIVYYITEEFYDKTISDSAYNI